MESGDNGLGTITRAKVAAQALAQVLHSVWSFACGKLV